MLLDLVLWAGGASLIALGAYTARDPYARLQALRAADDNVRRYADWRGRGDREADRGITGADVMRQQLTARLRLRAAIAVAGVVLIVVGFVIR